MTETTMTAMPDKCPLCGHDDLRRQNAALVGAVRDLSSAIDGIEQALQYGEVDTAMEIIRIADKATGGYPREWFFDAEVSDDA